MYSTHLTILLHIRVYAHSNMYVLMPVETSMYKTIKVYNSYTWIRNMPEDVQYFPIFLQLGFTIAFNLECLFKIWCLGIRGYIKRSLHKFELMLAIGTSVHVMIIPFKNRTQFAYFQVVCNMCIFSYIACPLQYWLKFIVDYVSFMN